MQYWGIGQLRLPQFYLTQEHQARALIILCMIHKRALREKKLKVNTSILKMVQETYCLWSEQLKMTHTFWLIHQLKVLLFQKAVKQAPAVPRHQHLRMTQVSQTLHTCEIY